MADNIEAIILDIQGTIMIDNPIGEPMIKRKGLDEFLAKHKDKTIITFTDAGEQYKDIQNDQEGRIGTAKHFYEAFKEIGLEDAFDGKYFGWHMNKPNVKDIPKIAKMHGINPENVVFIGDTDKDGLSEKEYGTKFLKVPSMMHEVMNVPADDNIAYNALSKANKAYDFAKFDLESELEKKYH